MRRLLVPAFCVLTLVGCHSRIGRQDKSSVTVPLPPAHAGTTTDNVGETGETENNE